ncbi:MAG: branched-chain amino acid ABC transporter ATP-binding protein [Syntrophus sp. RIFOXYC2_FULL_54_9]|nr:MAG: branched-chain amino acid ABC transporter ATP-binding protein [Syntrophus sp. RIFOXYC2_FULL_54_9]HBB17182.1 branched-chain amino acid ABC transporter ATP-binding protein [Syntrophus sp. (in: bacteria)]
MTVLLEIAHLTVRYEKAVLINDLSLSVDTGELVALVGPNGAGKSTTLRAISGLVAWEREIKRRSTSGDITMEGMVTFDGERIDSIPAHEIVRRGLVLCPERRRPFREMTVLDNLLAGAYLQKDKEKSRETLGKVYKMFPVLKDRSRQISGTLSGGEQQMLAIGRALMSEPKLLCIDEPSTGLAPLMRKEVFEKIVEVKNLGITILLVEQEVSTVFKLASRNYVLSSGKLIAEGTGDDLLKDEILRKTYLGL